MLHNKRGTYIDYTDKIIIQLKLMAYKLINKSAKINPFNSKI